MTAGSVFFFCSLSKTGLPTPAEFLRYADASKPVILRGAAVPLMGAYWVFYLAHVSLFKIASTYPRNQTTITCLCVDVWWVGPKFQRFSKQNFLAKYSSDTVRVGDHPYPTQFGRGRRGMEEASQYV